MFRRFMLPVLALLIACPVNADDKKPAVDEAAAMAAMMKHAEVGPYHKKLEPMIGEWTFKAAFSMAPGVPAKEMNGTASRKWLFDGRFMHDSAKGAEAMPFQGMGLTGYDNSTKKYNGVWVDSMTTSIMISTGEVDSTGKVFTYHRDEFNPMYGQRVKARDVVTVVDNDHHTMEFYTTPPGGKEYKSGTIKYTRKK